MTIGIRRHALPVCLAGALLIPAIAAADPILIRWGHLEVSSFFGHGGELDIRGTDLQLEREFALQAFTGDGVFMPGLECFVGCPPGTSISLLAVWAGLDLPGTATLDGRTFEGIGSLASDAGAFVTFSGTAVAPPLDAEMTAIMAPFRFEGLFSYPNITETEILHLDLRGAGMATLWVRQSPVPGEDWLFARARYEFVDPIPEPGTLLLLGGGLAVLAGRTYRRRRRDHTGGTR